MDQYGLEYPLDEAEKQPSFLTKNLENIILAAFFILLLGTVYYIFYGVPHQTKLKNPALTHDEEQL